MIDIDAVMDDLEKSEADYLGIEDMADVFALEGMEDQFVAQAPVAKYVKHKSRQVGTRRGRVDDPSEYQVYNFEDR